LVLGRPGDTDMAGVNGGFLIVLGACLAVSVLQCVAATSYDVGGSSGWTIPSSSKLYSDWVKSTTFKLGDKLVFKFTTGQHNAYRVSKADYDKCSGSSPMEKYETGPATVTLNSTGHHYYICAVSGHCTAGQKVSVKVSTAAAPGSSPSPSPGTTATPVSPSSSQGPASNTGSSTPTSSANSPGGSKSGASHSAASAVAIFMVIVSGFATLFL